MGSASTKTGVAPCFIIEKAGEIMVNVGIMTSSPFVMPIAFTAMSKAAEPFATAIPKFRFT